MPPHSNNDKALINNHFKHLMLWAVLAIIWSFSFSAIKIGVETISPVNLVAGRMLIASCLMFLILKIQRQSLSFKPNDWLNFLVSGILGNVLPFFLISWGELHVQSGLAAVMMGIMPIMTVLLAHFFLKDEPLNLMSFTGVTIGFTGLIILVGGSVFRELGNHLLGQLSILAAATSYAMTTVYVRRYVTTPAPIMATGSITVGAVIISIVALILDPPFQHTPSSASIMAMLYLGVFATAFATLAYFYLVPLIGASRMSQSNFVIPVLGSIIGIVWLKEQINPSVFIALTTVLVGIYLVNRSTIKR